MPTQPTNPLLDVSATPPTLPRPSLLLRSSFLLHPSSFILLLLLTLPSCTVGPNYKAPSLPVPTTYKSESPTTQPATQPSPLATNWWTLYNDPVLTDLEESASRANFDLQAAMARVAQARAAARITRSQFFPVVTLDPSLQRSRSARARNGSASASTVNSVQIPFDVSYEIDIWGRVRRSYESARAQAQALAYDYHVVLQTLQADVAQNYFNLRALDLQADILARTVESYRRQIQLTREQFNAGLVSRIDLAQAQTQLSTASAQSVDVRRQRADVEHALAILLGRPPSELDVPKRPTPLAPVTIPPGLPSDLLRQRPDVAEAEQNLLSASALIGAAEAQFYPAVRLTGAAGFESTSLQHALDWGSRFWSIGPSVSVPIFEGGRLSANVEQARARYDELLADYRSSVLQAFREVEDSLTDLHLRAEQAAEQQQAVDSAREYLRLAEQQYKQGISSYLTVIDAERSLQSAELSAAQIHGQQMVSSVLLIKSLGGGWTPTTPLDKTRSTP